MGDGIVRDRYGDELKVADIIVFQTSGELGRGRIIELRVENCWGALKVASLLDKTRLCIVDPLNSVLVERGAVQGDSGTVESL